MTNNTKQIKDATEYHTSQVQAALRACEHYLDKVLRVKSSDIHERNKHQANLEIGSRICRKWLSSDHTNDTEEWKKARALVNNAAHFVGLAATWLHELAWQ